MIAAECFPENNVIEIAESRACACGRPIDRRGRNCRRCAALASAAYRRRQRIRAELKQAEALRAIREKHSGCAGRPGTPSEPRNPEAIGQSRFAGNGKVRDPANCPWRSAQ